MLFVCLPTPSFLKEFSVLEPKTHGLGKLTAIIIKVILRIGVQFNWSESMPP